MKTTPAPAKSTYSKPRLTVHGNVEALTQTWTRCVPHRVYNCCRCNTPCS